MSVLCHARRTVSVSVFVPLASETSFLATELPLRLEELG